MSFSSTQRIASISYKAQNFIFTSLNEFRCVFIFAKKKKKKKKTPNKTNKAIVCPLVIFLRFMNKVLCIDQLPPIQVSITLV